MSRAEPTNIKAFLTGPLALVVDEPESGPFADEGAYMRTLEACLTLEVVAHKLAAECQQRVLSYASRDFADSAASSVARAMDALPLVRSWADKLRTRLTQAAAEQGGVRSSLPDGGHEDEAAVRARVCDVYELSPVERRILGAILMIRASHAFNAVKLGASIGYGGLGGGGYGGGTKPAITLCSIIDVSLADISAMCKPERRFIKQGVVTPGVQLLSELPSLQLEAVLLLLNLPLNETQLFNIEKTDLMKILREEPGFDDSKLAPKKRSGKDGGAGSALSPLASLELSKGGATSLYSLLQMEVAAEAKTANGGAAAAVSAAAFKGGVGEIADLEGGGGGDDSATADGGGGGGAEDGAEKMASPSGRATRSRRGGGENGGKSARAEAEAEAEDDEEEEEASGKPPSKMAKVAKGGGKAKGKAAVANGKGSGDTAMAEEGNKAGKAGKAGKGKAAAAAATAASADVGKEEEAAAAAAAVVGAEEVGEEEEADYASKPRSGPYDGDLEYLQDMFQLVKLRADIARTRRHMEERGQQLANTRSGNSLGANGDADGSGDDDEEVPPPMEEGYWGMDEYSYEMEALSRGRFGRNMRHEHSKQRGTR